MPSTPSSPNDGRTAAASERYEVRREGDTLRLFGDLRIDVASSLWRDIREETDERQGHIVFDLSKVDSADGGVIALLVELREELAARGLQAELTGANPRIEAIVQLYAGHQGVVERAKSESDGAVARVGHATLELRLRFRPFHEAFVGA